MEDYRSWLQKAKDDVRCTKIDSEFGTIREKAATLYPYYVETRYPDLGDLSPFTQEQAKEAFEAATKIVQFVENKLH